MYLKFKIGIWKYFWDWVGGLHIDVWEILNVVSGPVFDNKPPYGLADPFSTVDSSGERWRNVFLGV